ncbi:hypothetical protein CVT25_003133 [Psilocybe cyanescens]|uniref:Uncharacterized protein n=1 Tax=Psilocybe cyanescens TaxID=93625 RepID=A0A409XQW3_PSICY|nr:hypothetical protein CVT25_003133 [Psilocybe cyanescens]
MHAILLGWELLSGGRGSSSSEDGEGPAATPPNSPPNTQHNTTQNTYATPGQHSPIVPSYSYPGHRCSYLHITIPPPASSTSPSASFTSTWHCLRVYHGGRVSVKGADKNKENNKDAQRDKERPLTPHKMTFQLSRDSNNNDNDNSSVKEGCHGHNTMTKAKSKLPRDADSIYPSEDEDMDILHLGLLLLLLHMKAPSLFDQLGMLFLYLSLRARRAGWVGGGALVGLRAGSGADRGVLGRVRVWVQRCWVGVQQEEVGQWEAACSQILLLL